MEEQEEMARSKGGREGEEGEEEGRGLTRRGDGGSGRSTSGRGWRGAAPRGWDGEGGVWRAAVAAAARSQAGGRGGGAPCGGRGAAAEGLGWGGRWQRVGAVVVRARVCWGRKEGEGEDKGESPAMPKCWNSVAHGSTCATEM